MRDEKEEGIVCLLREVRSTKALGMNATLLLAKAGGGGGQLKIFEIYWKAEVLQARDTLYEYYDLTFIFS